MVGVPKIWSTSSRLKIGRRRLGCVGWHGRMPKHSLVRGKHSWVSSTGQFDNLILFQCYLLRSNVGTLTIDMGSTGQKFWLLYIVPQTTTRWKEECTTPPKQNKNKRRWVWRCRPGYHTPPKCTFLSISCKDFNKISCLWRCVLAKTRYAAQGFFNHTHNWIQSCWSTKRNYISFNVEDLVITT
jgi:hypothetical protein